MNEHLLYTVLSASQLCSLIMQYEYLWADGVKVKKPVRLTAPEYINALCDWIETQVRDLLYFALSESDEGELMSTYACKVSC